MTIPALLSKMLEAVEGRKVTIIVSGDGGGHVSQLLLSKLARKRLGFDLTRWMGVEPYPSESPAGPMVAITNEYAGSDGDIFSHSWKMMKLGKLIGKRTWGGVIGIWPRNSLVDGTLTSQPEFSFWFKDVGWNVENYGTDVDIEVHNTPKDFQNNVDAQLNKAIELVKYDADGNISFTTIGKLISNINQPVFEINNKIVINPPYDYLFNNMLRKIPIIIRNIHFSGLYEYNRFSRITSRTSCNIVTLM